ncbi:MAG: lipase maturation factor family protein [Vulcanimicrobiota bacterium]
MLQQALGAIFLIAFASALHQFGPLLSSRGLLPIPDYLHRRTFKQAPSLFHWRYSDRLYRGVCWLGIVLSLLALAAKLGLLGWLLLTFLYLSLVNVGQRFYGFGWESMLVEAGFFAAFMPGWAAVFALRWMLFRTEMGAGLIKLRHDRCWRDFSCLDYHYETQPVPNPWSWYFHRLPRWFHRLSVLGSHLIQLAVPFALFLPQPWAWWAGLAIIAHNGWLIISGNYAWLNWLTLVLAFSAFPGTADGGWLQWPLLFFTLWLSKEPLLNLTRKSQLMNYSYNAWRLVNAYGAFGSVSRQRYEVILQGSDQLFPEGSDWREYEFWAKPGDPARRPPQIAPYHLRLDWLIWFVPLGLTLDLSLRDRPERRLAWRYETWFIALMDRLLENDSDLTRLLRYNPFAGGKPPTTIRAVVYHYRYSTAEERQQTGHWWVRTQVGVYLPDYHGDLGNSRTQRS